MSGQTARSVLNFTGWAILVLLVLLFSVCLPLWQWLEPTCLEKRLPYDGPNGFEMRCHPDDLNPRSFSAVFN